MTNQITSLEKANPDNAQMQEVNLNLLQNLEKMDRTDWSFDMYMTAMEEIGLARTYSKWMVAKLSFEAKKYGRDEELARAVGMEVGSLRNLRTIYKRFHEVDPNYVPNGYVPFAVLAMASKQDDPIKTVELLEDENAVTIKSAHRKIKEAETGVVLPPKPVLSISWNDQYETWDIELKIPEGCIFRVTGSDKQIMKFAKNVHDFETS